MSYPSLPFPMCPVCIYTIKYPIKTEMAKSNLKKICITLQYMVDMSVALSFDNLVICCHHNWTHEKKHTLLSIRH